METFSVLTFTYDLNVKLSHRLVRPAPSLYVKVVPTPHRQLDAKAYLNCVNIFPCLGSVLTDSRLYKLSAMKTWSDFIGHFVECSTVPILMVNKLLLLKIIQKVYSLSF